MAEYPAWAYFPANATAPAWVRDVVDEVAAARPSIDSALKLGLDSDGVLAALRPGLVDRGYEVERGKKVIDKIRRPVLYGDQGTALVTYDIDAWHPAAGIVVEIEAGRGAMSNAVERDLLRTSLIVDARFLVLGVMNEYHYVQKGRPKVAHSFRDTRALLGAIYASGRLLLPFEGVLLFGY